MSLRKHFYPIKDKKISGALKAKRERPKSKKTSQANVPHVHIIYILQQHYIRSLRK